MNESVLNYETNTTGLQLQPKDAIINNCVDLFQFILFNVFGSMHHALPYELANVKTADVEIIGITYSALLALEKQEHLLSNQVVEQYLRFVIKNTNLTTTPNILRLQYAQNFRFMNQTRCATILLPVQIMTYSGGISVQPNEIVNVKYIDLIGMKALIKTNSIVGWLSSKFLLQNV